jgi:hypothetical protein
MRGRRLIVISARAFAVLQLAGDRAVIVQLDQ